MITVIIAEDEKHEADYLQEFILENYRGQISLLSICNDGVTAIQKATELYPDLMLLDIEMPRANGIAVAQEVKKFVPSCYFIILTAHATFSYAQEALTVGITDYLVKPYLDDDLKKAINNVLHTIEHSQNNTIASLVKKIADINSPNITHPIIRLANNYIEENYAEQISLETMAQDIGYSTSYVSKCLNRITGKNFNRLLLERRLLIATELLTQDAVTVSEVAYTVGFSDPNYFYKCFKGFFGISPKKYAKAIEENT
ncbi:MAG: response regulator [Sphaerochaeta sp.]|nr:response regulator [Sphaerochaeta sp.]